MAAAPPEFVCPFCAWEGTQPTLDAHANPWCPRCGRPVQFKALLRPRRGGLRGTWGMARIDPYSALRRLRAFSLLSTVRATWVRPSRLPRM